MQHFISLEVELFELIYCNEQYKQQHTRYTRLPRSHACCTGQPGIQHMLRTLAMLPTFVTMILPIVLLAVVHNEECDNARLRLRWI